MKQDWQRLSEEILTDIQEWRGAHPTATFRQIEEEVHARMSRIARPGAARHRPSKQESGVEWRKLAGASTLSDLWHAEASRVGSGHGTYKQREGRTSRSLEVMAAAPRVGWVFFPLDEQ